MKKLNSPITIITALLVLLFVSITFNFKFISLAKAQRARILSMQDDDVRLREYKEALRLADIIMDNNDVWDMDGSDVMSDYLDIRANMDTTFYHSVPENALLDNLALDYNE